MSTRDPYDDDRRYDRDGYDDYHSGEEGDDPVRRRAQNRVKMPALFLIIMGLFSLLFAVGYVTLLWAAPDFIIKSQYDGMKQIFPNQPMPPYEEFVEQTQIQGTIFNVIRMIMSLIIVVGAIRMRALKTYGLAMTASVIALIPLCSSECCFCLPFGIWALVVLLNSEVKRSF